MSDLWPYFLRFCLSWIMEKTIPRTLHSYSKSETPGRKATLGKQGVSQGHPVRVA